MTGPGGAGRGNGLGRIEGREQRRKARNSRVSVALVALLTPLVASCGGNEPHDPAAEATVLDSAGIHIVTHPPGPFTDTVSGPGVVTVGREGDPDYELYGVNAVLALASGNLVVANSGNREVRFYGPDGQYLRTVGGQGDGPSEFGYLSDIWLRDGDTLAVKDPRRGRIAFFDSAGTLAGATSFASHMSDEYPGGMCFVPGLMGLLADGGLLMRGWGCTQLEGRDGIRPTRMPLTIVRESAADSLGIFDVSRSWERSSASDPAERRELIPFAGGLGFTVGDDRVHLSLGMEHEIRTYDQHGRLRSIIREAVPPPAVTEADRDAYRAERAAEDRPHPDDVPFPERFGGYAGLLVSHEGDLWARRSPRPTEELGHWVVFSETGEEIRRVVLPDVRVRSVRDGRVYATRTDSLGIQTVVAWELPWR